MNTKYTFFFMLLIICFSTSYSQKGGVKNQYLNIQTGFVMNNYNAGGVRLFFEYQKEIAPKWSYGVSYEHTRFMGHFMTDYYPGIDADLDFLNFNIYYRVNLYQDYLYWNVGLGTGAFHAGWADSKGSNHDKFSYNLSAAATLNIRLFPKVYLQLTPVPILIPVNRFYYSSVTIKNVSGFYGYNFFLVGVKIKL